MKNITLIFTITLSVLFFCSITSEKPVKYFEGEIIYDIEYKALDEEINESLLPDLLGIKSIFTFKKGDYKTEVFNSENKLIHTTYYDRSSGKSYLEYPDQDTVYYVDNTKRSSTSSFQFAGTKMFMDEKCIVLICKTEVSQAGNEERKVNAVSKYTYSEKIKINPEWYKKFKEADYDKIVKATESIPVEKIEMNRKYKKHQKATSINDRKVDNSELEFDFKDHPLLEL